MFDAAALSEDWGMRPDQVVDFQALVGDPVDNVPGVPLIGPKIASACCRNTTRSTICWSMQRNCRASGQNLIEGREQAL